MELSKKLFFAVNRSFFQKFLKFDFFRNYKEYIFIFFKENPAFFFGLNILLGAALYFDFNFLIFFLILFFNIFFIRKYFLSLLIVFFGFFLSMSKYPDIKKIDKPIYGKGTFKILNIKKTNQFKKNLYQYKCKIINFKTKEKRYKNISAKFYSPKKLKAAFLYELDGELYSSKKYSFILKSKNLPRPTKKILSLTELRFQTKNKFFKYLKKNIKDKNVFHFLNAILLGDVDSSLLSFTFSKIGISHILAISGFHFSILILFLYFFLKLIFPIKFSYIILLILINIYFLFIGSTPSIFRSYIMASLAIVANIIDRKYSPINGLGAALFIMIFLDPMIYQNLGFQLSFLSCFAIFMIFPSVDGILEKVIKKRTLNELQGFDYLSKKAYLILRFIKSSFSLTMSVNIALFLLLLYHFSKFPILSFFYNLFIPFLITFVMFLIMITLLILVFLPFLTKPLFFINSFFISLILKVIFNPPALLSFFIRIEKIPFEFLLFYLVIIFLISIRCNIKKKSSILFNFI